MSQQVQNSLVSIADKNTLNRNWLLYYHFVRKDYDTALQIIEEIQTNYTDSHEFANQIKGLIVRQRGNIPTALDLLKKCHLFNSKNPEVLKHISRTLLLQGKYKASIDVASEAIKINAQDWENYTTQAECFLNLKDDDRALKLFQKANQISKHEQTYIQLGRYYYVRKMYNEAINVYKEGLDHSLENTEIMQTLGFLYLRTEQDTEAFQYLASALSLDPTDCNSLLAVSSIMQDQCEYDKSLARYRQMALLNPDSSQLWNNIAMCYYGKKRYINAIACLKKALYLDPFQFLTSLNLGLVYYTSEQYASAFHYFSTSIELNPEFATSYMYIGLCLNQLHDFQNACISFEKALEKCFKDDYIIPLNYAVVLAQRADSDENLDKARNYAMQFAKNYKSDDTLVDHEQISQQKEFLSKVLSINL